MSVFWHRPKVMRVGACLNEPSLNILRTVLMDSFSTYWLSISSLCVLLMLMITCVIII